MVTAVSGAEDVVLFALPAVQALVSITLIRVIVASMVWVRFILGSSFVGFGLFLTCREPALSVLQISP